MNRTLSSQLAFPTLLLATMWLVISGATTFHLQWLEASHNRIVTGHVSSLDAIGELNSALWASYSVVMQSQGAIVPSDPKWLGPKAKLNAALQKTETTVTTPDELKIMASLQQAIQEYEQAVDSYLRSASDGKTGPVAKEQNDVIAKANAISQQSDLLRVYNSTLIDSLVASRRMRSDWVGGIRQVLIIAGPVIGAIIGLYIARRTQQRVTQINLKLRDVSFDLGRLQLESPTKGDDLTEVDDALQKIAGRIKQVIAELDETRRETVRKERLAAVGQLTAGIAHELRNPLTAVKLLVQTTAQKAAAIGFNTKQLEVVQDEIARMERTIQALLDFARPAAPNRSRHDLRETLQRAINLVHGRAQQEGVTLDVDLPDQPATVFADMEQLHQVYVNLLLNSLDATSRGGHIQISLRAEANGGKAPSKWITTVADSGSGIPPNLIEHIFDPFVTSKERGTGLGLAVSRGIVEEHDGRLLAENSAEAGAIFTMEIPSGLDEATDPPRPALQETAP